MAFNDSKKEYTIENMYPKRPLINYLWNEKYIAVINQFGCGRGMTELENHYWHNIFREGDSRLIFIKYEDEVYAVNRNYNNQIFEPFSTTVGQGYSTIKSEYKKIESEFTILVPNEGMRECWELKLTNKAKKDISFDLYAYADVDAQLTEHLSCNISDFNKELNGICVSHKVYASPSNNVKQDISCIISLKPLLYTLPHVLPNSICRFNHIFANRFTSSSGVST